LDNIKILLPEVEWVGTVWIDLAQDRKRWQAFVSAVVNLVGSIPCREFIE
jgi:hypothetical protein